MEMGGAHKACIFHAWLSPGNEASKAPRAESMSTFCSSSAKPGIHSEDECCTHPSDAFVIMKAFPTAHAW